MEYTTVEGRRLSSNNYECQNFRYVKSRDSSTTIYLKCPLFRSHASRSSAKIDKISDLLEVMEIHIHFIDAHNIKKIVLTNNIKREQKYLQRILVKYLMTVVEIRK